jgi:hypothetical protein
MFEQPIKGDPDRSLSLLMHDARHRLMDERNQIKSDAIKAGAFQSNRMIVDIADAADKQHKEAMKKATSILLVFIDRMRRLPAEITGWARPHLENLSNSLLGVIRRMAFRTITNASSINIVLFFGSASMVCCATLKSV